MSTNSTRRCTADQIGRGAAGEQEAGGPRPPIGQHPQDGEKIGTQLRFVDDDQAAERSQ
jgi:hypothetical protein